MSGVSGQILCADSTEFFGRSYLVQLYAPAQLLCASVQPCLGYRIPVLLVGLAVCLLLLIAGSGGTGINGSTEIKTATCSSSSRGRSWR